jgi:heat shock protein HslJ
MTLRRRRLVIAWLLVATMVVVGCAAVTREAHPTTLANTAWRAVSINGQPVVAGSEPTAKFMVTDSNGSGGCNDWFSPYKYDPSTGRLTFEQLAMTARGCLDPTAASVETAFANVLSTVSTASIDPDGRLVLAGSGGQIVFAVDGVGG